MATDRKLAAIMFTDIVGFTKMMSSDEDNAMQAVERNRSLMKPLVEGHSGTWLKELGDGTLCSFNSAVEAVNCAIEIQQAMQKEKSFDVRIGIHLGDVVFAENDIYGDGVNVAARIEPLAITGSICISGQVYDAIRSRADINAVSLGERDLKNVGRPITVYALNAKGLPLVEASEPDKNQQAKDEIKSEKKAEKVQAAVETTSDKTEPIVTQLADEDHHKKSVTGKRAIILTALLVISILLIYLLSQESLTAGTSPNESDSQSTEAKTSSVKLAYGLDFSEWIGQTYEASSRELRKLQSRGSLRIYPSAFSEYDADFVYLAFAFDSNELQQILLMSANGSHDYFSGESLSTSLSDWSQIIYIRTETEE